MSFYLCHHCLEWVLPAQGYCPRCERVLELSVTDPPLEKIQRRMGHLQEQLGTVRVLHNELRSLGILYQTSQGLLFVPFQLHDIIEEEKCPRKAANWWNSVTSIMPQTNLWDWLKEKMPTEQQQADSREEINTTDPVGLARLLMQHPGVFFLERSVIHKVQSRRRHWSFHRSHAHAVRLKTPGEWRQFQTNMEDLLRTNVWQELGSTSPLPPVNP